MGATRRAGSAVVALVVLLVACQSSSAPPAQPTTAPTATAAPRAHAPLSPPVVVRAATTPSISNGGRYIAMERGYFQEEGVEIEDVTFDTSAKSLPALASGQVDLVAGGPTSGLFNAVAQGIPVRIVLDQWTGYPGNEAGGVIVRKELMDSGQLQSPADLRGLRLAMTSKGHATQRVWATLLDEAGLTFDDVDTTELSYPNMNVALGNNAIDAAVSIEPYASQAIGAGFATRWKSWADVIPYDAVAVVMYSESFAEGNNEAAKRYAKAYVRGLRDYNDARTKGRDREEVIRILQENTPLKDRAIYDQMPWPSNNPNGRVNAEAIAAAQDWFFENGYVQHKVDLAKVIDNQFADYAVAQLGPYQQ